MTFERRETMLGFPTSRWRRLPEGTDKQHYYGIEPYFPVRPGRVMGKDVTTVISADNGLVIQSESKITTSWTEFKTVITEQKLEPGSPEVRRVLGVTPGHQILFRWNGKR